MGKQSINIVSSHPTPFIQNVKPYTTENTLRLSYKNCNRSNSLNITLAIALIYLNVQGHKPTNPCIHIFYFVLYPFQQCFFFSFFRNKSRTLQKYLMRAFGPNLQCAPSSEYEWVAHIRANFPNIKETHYTFNDFRQNLLRHLIYKAYFLDNKVVDTANLSFFRFKNLSGWKDHIKIQMNKNTFQKSINYIHTNDL